MSPLRISLLTVLSMLAFAANSLLCRAALKGGSIDPASFTALRLGSGALALALVMRVRGASSVQGGSWRAAFMLFFYAALFSLAYVQLPAGAGALLLFGTVQVTMIAVGLWRGERLGAAQWAGVALAMAGLVVLILPGLTAPPLASALLMMAAGVAWGAYSLWGKSATDAGAATAGNFVRAVPMAAALLLAMWAVQALQQTQIAEPVGFARFGGLTGPAEPAALKGLWLSAAGVLYALCSGAVTSGLGYIVWYSVLPQLRASAAATVQLSVPLIAALGGVVLLGEAWTPRLAWSAIAMLGGIALVVLARRGQR